MKQLGFFLVVSVIFHFLVSTSALYFAEKLYLYRPKAEPTQIEIIEDSGDELKDKIEKTRQLVKQLENTVRKIQNPEVKARFESEKTQRVEKETKAALLGPTMNSSPQAARPAFPPPPVPETPETAARDKGPGDEDLPEFARARPNIQQVPRSQQSAVSSLLPGDIQNANATNLNTDANTYYSFYSRVEDLFYVRWVERVRYYWDRIDLNYKKTVLSGKVWSTQIEVWLTANGEFHSAYIKQPSGYKPFDEATVFAFKDAKFFPNPPRAKVEPDGFVRLRYRFNVYVDAY